MTARSRDLADALRIATLTFAYLFLASAGVLFVLAGWLFFVRHANAWTPVRAPISLDAPRPASVEVITELKAPYRVEIDLQRSQPFERLAQLPPPEIVCSVWRNGRPVRFEPFQRRHFTKEYPSFNWSYWGGDHFGSTVGQFQGVPGVRFTVQARVRQPAPKLQPLEPHLQIRVDPITRNEVAIIPGIGAGYVAAFLFALGLGLRSLAREKRRQSRHD